MADPVEGRDTEPYWKYYEEADYKALEAQLVKITADRDGIQSRLNERLRVGEEMYQELKCENERLRAALAAHPSAIPGGLDVPPGVL
jgi:hypothetical protein